MVGRFISLIRGFGGNKLADSLEANSLKQTA